jgi:hypothetical protein
MNLTARLHDLSEALTAQIIDLIRDLTMEELLDQTADDVKPVPSKPKAPRKARKTRTVAAQERSAPAAVEKARPEAPPDPVPQPAPQPLRKLPFRESSLPSYRKEIEARLEKAVYDFIVSNPGADAGLVSMKIGVPVGKAQGLLDDFVMKGRMSMKSGERGRCYRVS